MYEMGICSKCHQEKKIYNKVENLCKTCYSRIHKKIGICSECNRERPIKNESLNLCSGCYERRLRSRPGYVRKQRIGICSGCQKERPLVTKDNLCNSCHVKEYKRRTGYKGPVRACVVCGKVTNIHSNNMCKSCYNKKYAEENHDRILENKRRDRAANPEKYRNWDREWKKRNHERVKAMGREKYWENIESSRRNRRESYIKRNLKKVEKNRIKYIAAAKKRNISVDELIKESKLDELKKDIPELKIKWLDEFLMSVYAERSYGTKYKFLLDLNRLLKYLKQNNSKAYWGAWNMLSIIDIEQCQVETGPLKDSLRVFFRWLKKRKFITCDLQKGIPTSTHKQRCSAVSIEELSKLARRLYSEKLGLEVRLAGLLIIFYLFTNEQLRNLETIHLRDKKIFFNGAWHNVDEKIWHLIEDYMKWREDFYLGYAPKYFFVTGYTIKSQSKVSIKHFSHLFIKEKIGLSPSMLRKAMIIFHKEKTGLDPFGLGSIAGIQARSATRY